MKPRAKRSRLTRPVPSHACVEQQRPPLYEIVETAVVETPRVRPWWTRLVFVKRWFDPERDQ